MKQIIVIVSMVILGVAIAGMVLSLRGPAQSITDGAARTIESVLSEDLFTQGE